ncbi:MAG: cell filamentation protein Fic [Nitrospinae bacterium RIFCSPLOWO2_02_39_17]|nr:MAG: cell filamentation protein Fic [Nitrospinae bacterium RIFCSPLOWO2_02_39_17]OGW08332.1 MAG: cell filamentation protein Fic [Nitrospinae bacterium RIFCSPLOWO2_12_39_15]OGW08826.1 MAG: cell filamentation protein Fic [Nitrospinae bacterium RIFCSPLOWO2_12_FULL_39_93]
MKQHTRYNTSVLPEAQFEPGSRDRVLKNKPGIKRKREIDEAESVALAVATDNLLRIYDAAHCFRAEDIKTMHKIWLGEIYEWAGEYRQVNVSKGDFPFAAAMQIPLLMAEFGKSSLRKHTPCNFKSHERVIQALAEVHVELVLIHPFREGNGRVARILSTIMASQAGLPILNFKDITSKKRKEYFASINRGLSRDYKPMERLFEKIVEES